MAISTNLMTECLTPRYPPGFLRAFAPRHRGPEKGLLRLFAAVRRRLGRWLLHMWLLGLAGSSLAQQRPTALQADWPHACGLHTPAQAATQHPQPQLLAVLSPLMPMALPEWPRMHQAAVQAGFAVHVWRDPRVSLAEWQAAQAGAGKTPPALPQHAPCPLLNHMPAFAVARCGHVHPWPIWGVMPTDAWRHILQVRLNDLQDLPCP